MAADVQTGMEKPDMKKLLASSKNNPVPCAMGVGKDAAVALLFMHRTKQPRALEKDLTAKFPDAKSTRFGHVFVDTDEDAKLAKFRINKPASGLARRLAKTLRGTGFSKVEIVLDDGTPVESFSGDEEEDATTPAAAAAGTPAPGAHLSTLQAELAALIQRIPGAAGADAARKAALAKLAGTANASLRAADVAGTQAALNDLRAALDGVGAALRAAGLPIRLPAAGTPAPAARSGFASVDGLKIWREAREAVNDRFAALQDRVREEGDPNLQQVADAGLPGLTRRLGTRIQVALLEVDSAGPERAGSVRADALEAVSAYREFLAADPLVRLLDENPFSVALDIRSTLDGALDRIQAALA